ncbi:tail fiber protein [Pantoea sp. JGM49]|nr:tail fiber protein [Pantoea sp. JGM49]
MYVRSLSAQWNASAPVWEAWSAIGEQPIQGYINDANAALTPGTYSVTGAASNMPMVSSPTGILEVKLRLSSNSLLQRFTSITTSSATINRSWQRTLSGTTWSPWTQTTLRPNELTTQTDANTLTESGVYYGNYTNGPSGSAYGFLEVKATGTTGVISQVYHSTTANQRFIRTCTSANGWSVWVELVRADSVMNNLVPVGVPMPWPAEAAPSGWLKCNGASFSATTYPELAKAYPSLKLPDLRGEFIRGWDDGRGIDTGRAILSLQTDALQRITGTLEMGNGIGLMTSPHASTNGAFTEGPSREQTPVTQQKGGFAVTFDSANVVRSATETRPRNVAFNYIVRAA